MLRDVKFFILGFFAAAAGMVVAQTQILQMQVLGDGTFDGTTGTAALNVSNGLPNYVLDETDAAADNQTWALFAASEVLRLSAYTDDGLTRGDILVANRTGATIDDVTYGSISTFTQSGFSDNSAIQLVSNQPGIQFEESDAPTDEGKYDFAISGGDFFLDLNNDAGTFQQAAMRFFRATNAISGFEVGEVDAFPETGTFEATFTNACTTSPAATVDFYKIGGVATIIFEDAISCTSDSVDFNTGTSALPTEITPVRNIRVPISNITDNGTGQNGCIEFRSSGQIRILLNSGGVCSVGAFTNSGTKGILATVGATYMLDNPT